MYFNITNSGSGAQNVATGNGAQYNNNGGGNQFNNSTIHGSSPQWRLNHEAEMLTTSDGRRPPRQGFLIAIICALPLEYDAVSLLFDQFWDEEDPYDRATGDPNDYTTGRIGKYDVVLALLPNMGPVAAAGSAAALRSSFPGLKLALLVGVCGGVPGTGSNEALLGDVIISKTIHHDLGRQYPGRFVAKDTVDDNLGRANKDVRTLIASFETEMGRQRLERKAGEYLKELQYAAKRQRRRCDYIYPGVDEDKLFAAAYRHEHRTPDLCETGGCNGQLDSFCDIATKTSCTELHCNKDQLVQDRPGLVRKRGLSLDDVQCPAVLVGRIASGYTVMKSGEHRDRFAKDYGVIAFEMEGAGVWDEVPCIVIKGICDYADSHKNKAWQPFAAATAASVAKAVLGRYVVTK